MAARPKKGGTKTRFLIVLGSLLGTLGAPFGEPFRSLWPPRGPKNRKNDALQGVCSRARFLIGFSSLFGCLGSLKTKIPCGRGTQNHIFDRHRKKHDFKQILSSFSDHLRPCWAPLAHLWGPRALVFCFFPHRFFYQFFHGF